MQRYFIENKQINNNKIVITNNDVHHIKNVMRMKVGDKIICCNTEKTFKVKIKSINDVIETEIIDIIEENNELKVDVSIAQGSVRREKIEEVIRRLTELGCLEYIPVQMMRSIAKVKDDKITRWEKIIKEASEQSHRNRLMKINEVLTLKELIALKNDYDLTLFAHVTNECITIKKAITNFSGKKILVVVGPEGGFANEEVKLLTDNGFIPIGLGKRVLRTETAPLYIMSAIGYQIGDENES